MRAQLGAHDQKPREGHEVMSLAALQSVHKQEVKAKAEL